MVVGAWSDTKKDVVGAVVEKVEAVVETDAELLSSWPHRRIVAWRLSIVQNGVGVAGVVELKVLTLALAPLCRCVVCACPCSCVVLRSICSDSFLRPCASCVLSLASFVCLGNVHVKSDTQLT